MKSIEQQLSNYAAYHRDARNIVTHFIGIPMIVLAVAVLLSAPQVTVAGVPFTPAHAVTLLAIAYYLRLEWRMGALMTVWMLLNLWLALWIASQGTLAWLGGGVALFVVGWVFQFVGHFYEGRKPAFVDDIMGLIIGPLFVAVEALFLFGLRRDLQAQIEQQVGPVRRTGVSPATTIDSDDAKVT
ncbi:MAG: DUF962 domain-containing protein [Betaproteobacteria bacterium]|jgi:uncharacterized membrane protein YGL010W|nr:DUF962 domain-containing protein [Betaproteobacteria bacterium]NBS47390.1 DUF962 domain-containing protein [Betaproteobacteria bacterium]